MKKLLLVSLLTLGMAAGAMAHDHKADGSRMAKHLEVTESQMPAFTAVMEAQKEKRRALFEAFRAQQDALEAETAEDLAGVLTPEQLTKLEDMKAKRQEKREERMEAGGERHRGHHGRRGGEGCDSAKAE